MDGAASTTALSSGVPGPSAPGPENPRVILPPTSAGPREPSSEQGSGRREGAGLDEEERRQLDRLKLTDRLVRQREETQGRLTFELWDGGPEYRYETGPDGKKYAVDGTVRVSELNDSPEEKLRRARLVRMSALIDIPPSPEGQKDAAKAIAEEGEAIRELRKRTKDPDEGGPIGGTLDVIG
jgi:hypothetical protein